MKILQNLLISTKSLVLIFLVIAIISITSVLIELQKSKEETLSLLEKQGHTLLESLLESSRNALLSYQKIEEEIKERLFDNGKLIAILYNNGQITNRRLEEIAAENKIYRINIFDKNARKIFSSHTETEEHENEKENFNPAKYLAPIYEGETDSLVIGIKPSRFFSGNRFAVALLVANKSVIVLNIDAENLLNYRKQIGFGALIQKLVNNEMIEYIILQDSNGILAGSGNLQLLKDTFTSERIQKSVKTKSYLWSINQYKEKKYFEAIHPFIYNKKIIGIFRLGLSLRPLEAINQRTERRLIFLGIVLFIFGIITIVLIFLRQNFDLLSKKFTYVSGYAKKIFDNVSDAIFVLDTADRIVSMNYAAEKLLLKNLNDSTGMDLQSLFPGTGCEKIINADKKYSQIECEINGVKRIFFVSKNEFTDTDGNLNKIFMLREITELKNLENQIAQNEKLIAISNLASTVAHEIRNPLNSIGTITQQLGKDFEPIENKEEYLSLSNLVYKEVRRINEIVENFLKYAKPKPIKRSYFSLNELLNQLKQQYDSILRNKNIKLIINSKISEDVNLDESQIKQVFINLIENSIDALNENGTIEITAIPFSNNLQITFSDNGKGINQDDLKNVFDLYFTTKVNGSGIGLSLIHKIITEHGGTIKVESEICKGTKFIITLPQTL
ncbi:MAG: hypothetical protein Fur0015_11670 [Ignavibacteriales bacterium]